MHENARQEELEEAAQVEARRAAAEQHGRRERHFVTRQAVESPSTRRSVLEALGFRRLFLLFRHKPSDYLAIRAPISRAEDGEWRVRQPREGIATLQFTKTISAAQLAWRRTARSAKHTSETSH